MTSLAYILGWYERDIKNNNIFTSSRWIIEEDLKREQSGTEFLLTTVHTEVLEALISGNFMHRYYHDSAFEAAISTQHKLDTQPGIYVNFFYRRKFAHGESTVAKDAGKSFSVAQLRVILDRFDLYHNAKRAGSTAYSRRCDKVFPAILIKDCDLDWAHGDRRYRLNADVNDEWKEQLRDLLARAEDFDDDELAEPLIRYFIEVGYRQNCLDRATGHAHNKQTNSLFGLVNAVCAVEWPEEFEVRVFQIFRLTEVSHGKLGELVGSILYDLLWLEGDLNPMLPGNVSLSQEHESGMKLNRERLFLNSDFVKNNVKYSQ